MYLGIDLSTQRAKATIIDDAGKIIMEKDVHFDEELRWYQTVGGVHQNGASVTSPTLMWVEAIDILFKKLGKSVLGRVKGVSASGQQHGSVFWRAMPGLESHDLDLKSVFRDAFTIQHSPIWQDTSTADQIRKMEEVVGGPEQLARLTGSSG
ncbi:hypothetical protein HDU91_001337 [Kappamyces sp. JEL0680]|nr:hypothetical protein HDU91_001337 [Kappamyces sp. JEL0680]